MRVFNLAAPGVRCVHAAAVLAVLAGCASSKLTNLWKDPAYTAEPMRKVLVVAVQQDALKRRLWEDSFTETFGGVGAAAVASYTLFPSALPDTQQVVEAVRTHGYDGVVVVHRIPGEVTETYVPGYVTTRPVTVLNHWTGAYYTYYQEVYQPGYTETGNIVRYQVDVWSTEDEGGRLVWVGTTQTLNPDSADEVREKVTKLIVPELVEQGVIGAE